MLKLKLRGPATAPAVSEGPEERANSAAAEGLPRPSDAGIEVPAAPKTLEQELFGDEPDVHAGNGHRDASAEVEGSQANGGAEEDVQLFCICRRPYVEGVFMFGCDGPPRNTAIEDLFGEEDEPAPSCSNWFHPACLLGGPMDAAEFSRRVSAFTCHECTGTRRARVVWRGAGKDGSDKVAEIDPARMIERKKTLRTTAGTAKPPPATVLTEAGLQEAVDYPALLEQHWDIVQPHSFRVVESGFDLSRDQLKEDGFDAPILIKSLDGLGMRLPRTLTPREAMERLGAEYPIGAMDVRFQTAEPMSLADFVAYMETPEAERSRVLNSISVEFSGTPMEELVERPDVVKELDWDTLGVWAGEENQPKKIALYWLCGAKGSYTDFHIDFGGTSVFYAPISGLKRFLFLRPTPTLLSLYNGWLASPNQHGTFLPAMIPRGLLDAEGGCTYADVGPGECLLIPSGWIHAVLTPEDSSVVGGNFLHVLSSAMQARVAAMEEEIGMRRAFRMPGGYGWFWRAAAWYRGRLAAGERFGEAERKGIAELVRWCKKRAEETRDLEDGGDREKEKARKMREEVPAWIGSTKKLWKELKRELKRSTEDAASEAEEVREGDHEAEPIGETPAPNASPKKELFDLDGAGEWVPATKAGEDQRELFDLEGSGDWVPVPPADEPVSAKRELFDLDGAGDWVPASPPKLEPPVTTRVVDPLPPSPPKLKLKIRAAGAEPAVSDEPKAAAPEASGVRPMKDKLTKKRKAAPSSSSSSGSDSSSSSRAPRSKASTRDSKPAPAKQKVRRRAASGSSSEGKGSGSDSGSADLDSESVESDAGDEYAEPKPAAGKSRRAFAGMDLSIGPPKAKKKKADAEPPLAGPRSLIPGKDRAPQKKKRKAIPAAAPAPVAPKPAEPAGPVVPKLGLIGLIAAQQTESAAEKKKREDKGSVWARLEKKAGKLKGKGDFVGGKKR
ncbi:hypothetical protein DFJ74DRAFT_683064 [Hyaloraphidium curvatum]|nr:hypothetical protein DFJ74DRAFT_683064 [Hyaloraphidium curvatum]